MGYTVQTTGSDQRCRISQFVFLCCSPSNASLSDFTPAAAVRDVKQAEHRHTTSLLVQVHLRTDEEGDLSVFLCNTDCFTLWNITKYNLCSHLRDLQHRFWLRKFSLIQTHYANLKDSMEPGNRTFTLLWCCTESFPVMLCGVLRAGRLSAAVHQDLWEGEGRGGPAAADHSPGAGGSGGVQDWPPGAHTGGCGFTVRSGESKLPSPSSHFTAQSLRNVPDNSCWIKYWSHSLCLPALSNTSGVYQQVSSNKLLFGVILINMRLQGIQLMSQTLVFIHL